MKQKREGGREVGTTADYQKTNLEKRQYTIYVDYKSEIEV